MNKPLVLTIHPRLEDTNLNPEEIRQGRVTTRNMCLSKRFTDAELAAEWQYQDNRCGQAVEGYGVAHDGTYMESEEVEIERLATVYRLATLPSYDEVA